MTPAPLPVDERFQLDALDALDLLDSGPDPDFDAIVALGRRLLDVPICLVTLVAAERQWFKANAGLAATETGRDVSFCGHAILKPEILVVPDARRDERFHDNPLVTGAPFIRFYAGAPIRLPNGYTVGTVCAISPEPREGFAPEDAALLDGLARLALGLISVRGLRRELDRERAERQRALGALDLLDAPVALLDPAGTLTSANAAFAAACREYPMPGESVFESAGLTPSDLDPAGFGADGSRPVTLFGGSGTARAATLHHLGDGIVLVAGASGAPPP